MLLVQLRVAECETVCTPVPDSEMAGELLALLTTATLPLKPPDVVGSKITPKVVLCPGAKVSGGVNPVTLNPAPETLV